MSKIIGSAACLGLAFTVAACSFEGAAPYAGGADAAADPTNDAGSLPGPACGNGVLDPSEQCDDSNREAGDGCSDGCAIEPSFECNVVGEACEPVTGIAWSNPIAPSGQLGNSPGGSPVCQAGFCDCGPNELLVGLEAGYRRNTAIPGVTELRTMCAPLSFDTAGVALVGDINLGTRLGVIDATGPISQLMCPDGQVVSGMRGSAERTGDCLRAVSIACVDVRHLDGAARVGSTANVRDRIGNGGRLRQTTACATGDVAVGIGGSSGEVIDHLTLRCATPAGLTQ